MHPPFLKLCWRISALAAVLLAAGTLLNGCAGTARGVERSVYRQAPSAAPAAAETAEDTIEDTIETSGDDKARALVVIRYPAMIHADAEPLFISSFAVNAIGGEVPYAMYGNAQTARIAQSVIAKSGYYAMSLYHELKQLLPEHTVLLSPHIIVWDEAKGLYSRPILASEQVPAVLTIDFSVYSFPDVTEMMDSPPVTFGDLVTPLIVVRGGRWARPALNGLLVASEPLLDAAWRQAAVHVDRERQARLADQRPVAERPLEFIAYLAERDPAAPALPVQNPGEGRGLRQAVERYPLEKLKMDSEAVARVADEGADDPFASGFARGAATRIVDLLGTLDHDRATFFARQAALARFDPELARVLFMRSADESVRARLHLAEALVAAEREFLSAQSESVYAGTFIGDYGVKMRKIIAAEYRMLEDRRRLARFQNMTSAVAALALAGSVYGATVSTTASATLVATLSGVSLMGSIWAMNKSMDARSESEEVNEYFIARMAPTFERQMSVQTEWLESKEVITARGFAEFRTKTLTLYQSRVRSMGVAAERRCVFRHPEFAEPGAWQGACVDGSASGPGYGVIRVASGAAVEYLGQARDGLADGAGAMILAPAGAQGADYYEGSFVAGLPDGLLRVERPGEEVHWREYRAGRDVGRGQAPQTAQALWP